MLYLMNLFSLNKHLNEDQAFMLPTIATITLQILASEKSKSYHHYDHDCSTGAMGGGKVTTVEQGYKEILTDLCQGHPNRLNTVKVKLQSYVPWIEN